MLRARAPSRPRAVRPGTLIGLLAEWRRGDHRLAGGSPDGRSRARRRQRPWLCPHRRAALVRGTSHPDRLHQRHEHGRPDRRGLRRRHEPAGDPGPDERGRLGPHVHRGLAVQVQDLSPQAGQAGLPVAAGTRPQGRHHPAGRPQSRPADRAAPRSHRALLRRHGVVRRPADAVPVRRDRPEECRGRGPRPRLAGAGHARDDGHPGCVHAGELRELAAGRRRRPQQHSRRRDQEDGGEHGDCRQRRRRFGHRGAGAGIAGRAPRPHD